jgi:hypothetical protein
MPDFKDHRAQATAAPSIIVDEANRTKLFRTVTLLVNQVDLIKYLPRLLQADAMLSFNIPALLPVEVEALGRITLIPSRAPLGHIWRRTQRLEHDPQFDAVWDARIRKVGLSTMPRMIDDQRYS